MSKLARQRVIEPDTPPKSANGRLTRTKSKEPQGTRPWSAKDDAFLRRHCETMTDAAVGAALGRSRDAVVQRRLGALQLPKKGTAGRWTSEDNAMLIALYGEVDTFFLAGMLSYSVRRMRQHAARLGLRTPRLWSLEEDEILQEHFPSTPITQFAELLPGRSLQAIYGRANSLSLSRELPYLLSNWRYSKFHAYPPELKALIRLHRQVERKLQDVQTKH